MRPAETFRDFIHAQVKRYDVHRAFFDKFASRKIAAAADVPTPQLLAQYKTLGDMDLSVLPEQFVLKPTTMASRRGVLLLRREGQQFFDLFSKRSLSEAEIRKEFATLFGTRPGGLIAEELVPGPAADEPIPYDYKLFTFYDGVQFVLQINRNGDLPKLAFFDGTFTPVENDIASSRWQTSKPAISVEPSNALDMLKVARRVHKCAKLPFVSVDLYTDGERVVLGEVTASPGAAYFGAMFYFSPQFDRYLGGLWARSFGELGLSPPYLESDPPPIKYSDEDQVSYDLV